MKKGLAGVHFLCALLFISAGLVGKTLVNPASAANPPAPLMPRADLGVVTPAGKTHQFKIEVAATTPHRRFGLMYRWELPEDAGMLFVFEHEAVISMWMRNTFIPLAMLFIRSDGTIARVVDRTTPLSEESVYSGEPIIAVLELNAGMASRLKITAGSRLDSHGLKLINAPGA
jgi:uncharacterized membrane protein (UPF0127 family)